jgi:hypothetical protein
MGLLPDGILHPSKIHRPGKTCSGFGSYLMVFAPAGVRVLVLCGTGCFSCKQHHNQFLILETNQKSYFLSEPGVQKKEKKEQDRNILIHYNLIINKSFNNFEVDFNLFLNN